MEGASGVVECPAESNRDGRWAAAAVAWHGTPLGWVGWLDSLFWLPLQDVDVPPRNDRRQVALAGAVHGD